MIFIIIIHIFLQILRKIMENNLSSMLDVFTDLMQAITKLIKNTNEKTVLESINYLIKCMCYLYERMGLKPYIAEDLKRDSVLSGEIKLHSIEEVHSEESSPFVRDRVLLNPGGYLEDSNEIRFSRTDSFDKCHTPLKLQTGNEGNSSFETITSKIMTTSSMAAKDYKKLLESKYLNYFFEDQSIHIFIVIHCYFIVILLLFYCYFIVILLLFYCYFIVILNFIQKIFFL